MYITLAKAAAIAWLLGALLIVMPVGTLVDWAIATKIQNSVWGVEELKVKSDRLWPYNLVRGQIDHLTISSQDLAVKPQLIINRFELETGAVEVNMKKLNSDHSNAIRLWLRKPLDLHLRLVLTEANLNQALLLPKINALIQQKFNQTLNRINFAAPVYVISQLQVKLIEHQLYLSFQLQPESGRQSDPLLFEAKINLKWSSNHHLGWVKLQATVNQQPISPRILASIEAKLARQFDLNLLKQKGILAKILKLDIDNHKLELTAEAQIQPQT